MPTEKTYNSVKITILENKEAVSNFVANIILERIKSFPRINILVPAGTTPEGVYEILRNQPPGIFQNTTFFNMDEYLTKKGEECELLPESHPASYRKYMRERLFNKINPYASYFPGVENIKQPGQYDELIKNLGGIDICLNTIGDDGHTFGFNFPPEAAFDSVTRFVKITEDTQRVNYGLTGVETPNYAVSIGLKTGMSAKEIILLVSGERKAEILKKIIYSSKPTKSIPATLLKEHANCHWIVDKAAGSKLAIHKI